MGEKERKMEELTMAAKNFRKLFEPYTVKSMTLRNRIVMTPIGTNFAEHTGEVNERIIDYYKQRAKGGTGLITIEAVSYTHLRAHET